MTIQEPSQEQSFDTFREFLEKCKKEETFEKPTIVLPERGHVLTSVLTLEQCFVYLTDKMLQSTGTLRIDGDIYIIFLDGIDIYPFFVTSRERAISQEMKKRCHQIKLDKAIANGAAYFICYFRQYEHPWGNPEMCVSFVHEETFMDYDLAQKRAEELEEERYCKGDFNLQIEARLAVSREDAKEGIFIE